MRKIFKKIISITYFVLVLCIINIIIDRGYISKVYTYIFIGIPLVIIGVKGRDFLFKERN